MVRNALLGALLLLATASPAEAIYRCIDTNPGRFIYNPRERQIYIGHRTVKVRCTPSTPIVWYVYAGPLCEGVQYWWRSPFTGRLFACRVRRVPMEASR